MRIGNEIAEEVFNVRKVSLWKMQRQPVLQGYEQTWDIKSLTVTEQGLYAMAGPLYILGMASLEMLTLSRGEKYYLRPVHFQCYRYPAQFQGFRISFSSMGHRRR
jgi:hypothetical protein